MLQLKNKIITVPCAILAVGACTGWQKINHNPHPRPITWAEPSKVAPFEIDTKSGYIIELGRGSGMDGLDTVTISSDGAVTLFRLVDQVRPQKWETATIKMPVESCKVIAEKINSLGITKMNAAYHSDTCDGEQWVFQVKQGARSKSIYFNNNFPKEIAELAKLIDLEISKAGVEELQWKKVPQENNRLHEKALWKSNQD